MSSTGKLEKEKEYSSLRSEFIKRIEVSYSSYLIAITALGAIALFGLQSPEKNILLFFYPILALWLAIAWRHHAIIVRRISIYLSPISSWEAQDFSDKQGAEQDKIFSYINRAFFLASSIVAIIIGSIVRLPSNTIDWLLFYLSILIAIITGFISLWPLPRINDESKKADA